MSEMSSEELHEVIEANYAKTRGERYSVKELSNLTGRSVHTIRHIKTKLGLSRLQSDRLKLNSKEIAEYAAKHPEVSIREIGEHFGCSSSTVSKFMCQHGVGRNNGKVSKTKLEMYKAIKVFIEITRRNHEQNSVVVE